MEEAKRRAIKLVEGFRESAYKDAHGHSTGYGHFIKPGEEYLRTQKISKEEAETLLTKDIDSHSSGIKKWLKRPMNDLKMAALTSLAYNTGAESKAVKRIIGLYNEGKDSEAAAAFGEYNKAYNPDTGRKEVNEGLVKRREFERRLFTADDSASVEELYKETHSKKAKPLAVTGSSSVSLAGAADSLMNQNRDTYARLQELNLGLGEMSFVNGEFMQRLRREGGGGNL